MLPSVGGKENRLALILVSSRWRSQAHFLLMAQGAGVGYGYGGSPFETLSVTELHVLVVTEG